MTGALIAVSSARGDRLSGAIVDRLIRRALGSGWCVWKMKLLL